MSLVEFVSKQSAWMSKQVERCKGVRLAITGPSLPASRGAPWKKRKGAARGASPRKARARKSPSPA
jgi:DNA topoisomerase-3